MVIYVVNEGVMNNCIFPDQGSFYLAGKFLHQGSGLKRNIIEEDEIFL